MFLLSDSKVFHTPEADGSKPVSDKLTHGYVATQVTAQNGEISEKLDMAHVSETKAPVVINSEERHGTITPDRSNLPKIEQKKRKDTLSVITEDKSEEDLANQTQQEQNKPVKAMQVETSKRPELTDKSGNLAVVTGAHEGQSTTTEIKTESGEAKPELVTVKEGYTLATPKQKAILANEGQDCAQINDVRESKSNKQQRPGVADCSLPSAAKNKGTDSGNVQPVTPSKQIENENVVNSLTSSTPVNDTRKKLQTSLELSDIPSAFEQFDSGKDSTLNSFACSPDLQPTKMSGNAASRVEERLENKKVNEVEECEKTATVKKSHDDENSRCAADDSLWVLQNASDDKRFRKRNEEKRTNDNKNKRKRSTENAGKTGDVGPHITIDQSDIFDEETEKDSLGKPRENHAEEHITEEKKNEEKPRKRRASEPDVHFEPLSPLMEDRESSNTFLNPSGSQSAKVKRNKSLVARGISKVFRTKRKYKTDKEDNNVSSSSVVSDINGPHDDFDLKENRQEKKMKRKDKEGKTKDLPLHEGSDGKSSSRKFGGLFSRGKKKEKNANQSDRK